MSEAVGLAIGICTLLGILTGAYAKWVRPRIRKARSDKLKMRVTIIGADPVINPATGQVRSPAIPGIAALHGETAKAVNQLTGQVAALTENVKVLVDRELVGMKSDIRSLDTRVTVLEESRVERIVGQVAQAETFRAMGDLTGKPPADVPPAALDPE